MTALAPPVGGALVVELHLSFTFEGLCRASGASGPQVQALIDEGLLQPTGSQPGDWRFDGTCLARARTALRLARDLELGWAGAALVMDLLAEIAELRARLPRP
jgi:chaperone modulatory protein CbpM